MRFLAAILFYFNVINVPYTYKNNTDLLSLTTLSKTFNLDVNFTDSFIDISFGSDVIRIDPLNLTYSGKARGVFQHLEKDSRNVFLDAENAIYIAGALKGNYYYWDSNKHRIIESAYSPSIKVFEVKNNSIRIVHNIDLEPAVEKSNKTIIINVPYGFYFGPPFIYFDDAEYPVKSIKITYSSRGTAFKINLRRDIPFETRSSTGIYMLKLNTLQPTEKNQKEAQPRKPLSSSDEEEKIKKPHNKIDVIVIDPGHGGKDPGAISEKGTKEKDIVLAIAKKVAKKLRKKGFKVILTRDKDVFITLGERARIANHSKCDIFISIHANYSKGKRAHGIETYFLSEARTKWERSVAAFENSVIKYEFKDKVDEKNILKWILGDMAQNEFLRESQDLSAFIQESLVKKTGALDRGVKQAGFYVLRGVYAPSILIETGFITNPKEEKKLKSKKYQSKIADGIVDGILKYKRYYERKYGKF